MVLIDQVQRFSSSNLVCVINQLIVAHIRNRVIFQLKQIEVQINKMSIGMCYGLQLRIPYLCFFENETVFQTNMYLLSSFKICIKFYCVKFTDQIKIHIYFTYFHFCLFGHLIFWFKSISLWNEEFFFMWCYTCFPRLFIPNEIHIKRTWVCGSYCRRQHTSMRITSVLVLNQGNLQFLWFFLKFRHRLNTNCQNLRSYCYRN